MRGLPIMLTKRQKEVLDFIVSFIKKYDYAPSLEEIKEHLRLTSVSTAHFHVANLEREGYLSRLQNSPRSIGIPEIELMIQVPLLGCIAAGRPIEVSENQAELITIPKTKLPKSDSLYALKVSGHSMVDENINDGDTVIIRNTPVANNGEKVVALINNTEATLKKYYLEGDKVRLQPANVSLAPIYIDPENITIQGVVVSVLRMKQSAVNTESAAIAELRQQFSQPIPVLFTEDPLEQLDLKDSYYDSHLITYIGNKRSLLPFLYQAFMKVRSQLGLKKMTILDGFAGSGASARLLKAFSSELHVNDLEDYCETINKAFLANKSEIVVDKLVSYVNWLNENKLIARPNQTGFIESNYAPKDDDNIQNGERVFYTNKNAKIIHNIRQLIEVIPQPYKDMCLAELLVKASVHTNTSGVFKGFHKRNGVGHFGGNGENALSRIKQDISLNIPIFSQFECPVFTHKQDINKLVKSPDLPDFDLVYYDPPYNQHPYGSNYFMLNIINSGNNCEIQDGVSGIAKEWNKSAYNRKRVAEEAMDDLLSNTRSKFIAISYNNEGIIPINTFKNILSKHGKWELMERDYNTYRGSRNLRSRNIKVRELLWLLEKR